MKIPYDAASPQVQKPVSSRATKIHYTKPGLGKEVLPPCVPPWCCIRHQCQPFSAVPHSAAMKLFFFTFLLAVATCDPFVYGGFPYESVAGPTGGLKAAVHGVPFFGAPSHQVNVPDQPGDPQGEIRGHYAIALNCNVFPPGVANLKPGAPSPSHASPAQSCPKLLPPLSLSQCQGRLSTCWSVGVPDLDCPNWGLCCFDGCANTCLGNTPPPGPTPPLEPGDEPEPPRNPCDPSPCHRTAMCIPQEGRAMCKCRRGLEGDRPEPHPLIQCREPPRDPCNPSPCGVVYPGTTTCTPNVDGE